MVKQLITLLFLTSPYTFSQPGDSLLSGTQNPPVDSIITSIPDILPAQDSLITPVITEQPDTISPIQGQPLTSTSTIIKRQTFLFTNYRYTGDLLRSFPLNFIKDRGFIGQPNESFIYGIGNSGVSYLRDGVLWNNRYSNSLDLNHIQSEDIDSIEIVPSPRGFLYGPYNNPVTVNFISRDFPSPEPYSRIKYYEGPSGEAMIDGMLNANIFKRWNIGLQVTNRKFDSTYTNSEFSIWQINSKLKYFLSNSVNISAYYGYVDSRVGLNDGVDVDSISTITSDINSILYEPLRAPVISPNKKLETTQHNFVLRTLAKPFDNSKMDLSFYYKYSLDEQSQSWDSLSYKENKKNKSFGTILNYVYQFDFLILQLLSDYEKRTSEVIENDDVNNDNRERFSLGGVLTASLLDNFIIPSVYYKQNDYIGQNYNSHGMGADILFLPTQNQSLYIGYSIRDNIYSAEEYMPAFEIGTCYKSLNLMWDIKYFNNEYYYDDYYSEPPWQHIIEVRGIGLNLNYKLWLILLETNTSYFFEVNDERPMKLPDLQFSGGLYVNDFFFNDNLDLKAGFKFYYTGEILSSEYPVHSSIIVAPTNKLDFTLAGEIKKLAIFYFVWENLLNKQYYITPYYPMPGSNLRFGLAWELFN